MGPAQHHIAVGEADAVEIAFREVVVAAVVGYFFFVGEVLVVILVIVAFQSDALVHHLGEDAGEVHAYAHVLHYVAHVHAEHYEVVDIVIVTVDSIILHVGAFIGHIEDVSAAVLIVGRLIAPVDEVLAFVGEIRSVDIQFVQMAVDVLWILATVLAELLNLQHGVGQQCLIPFDGVAESGVKTEGLACLLGLEWCELVRPHIAVEYVVLHEAVQRVDRAFEVVEAVSLGIDIARIDGVVEETGQVIERVQVAAAGVDAVFLELCLIE